MMDEHESVRRMKLLEMMIEARVMGDEEYKKQIEASVMGDEEYEKQRRKGGNSESKQKRKSQEQLEK